MADHRITRLAPGLVLAALALSGCPGSPSRNVDPSFPGHPQSAVNRGTLTAQASGRVSGLIIEARACT